MAFADRLKDPTAWVPLALALAGGGGLTANEASKRTTVESNSQIALIAMVEAQQSQALVFEKRVTEALDKGIALGREMSCNQ